MRILLVNGSPLGKKGVTYVLQEAFVRGVTKAGAEVEQVFLNKKKIRPCRGCFSCWIKTPGRCIIRDDQADILEKVRWAEVFVLATPSLSMECQDRQRSSSTVPCHWACRSSLWWTDTAAIPLRTAVFPRSC
ncbi:MAG: flavodoxin family protein [Deltaproteobacteria bacterium]|nr:flavodoxin family protein [Deltaproteobacteria bacterium]